MERHKSLSDNSLQCQRWIDGLGFHCGAKIRRELAETDSPTWYLQQPSSILNALEFCMPRLSRRRFLSSSVAAAGALSLGGYVNPAPAQDSKSPNERLRIAGVGTTNRAGADLAELSSQEIVALADVDDNNMAKGSVRYPEARKYRDFRVMLEKEAGNLDAVMVGTADHTHAPAAAMALRMGKHVYCEKPLTHTVFE